FIGWADAAEGGVARLYVSRVNGTAGTVSVDYFTSGGSATENIDYIRKTGTVTFANGELFQLLEIPTSPDTEPECNESFMVQLTNATGGAVVHPAWDRKPVRIIDDDWRPLGTVECVSCYPHLPTTTIERGADLTSISHNGQQLLLVSESADLAPEDT